MSFKTYAAAKLTPGKTIPLVLASLPSKNGEKPVIDVEMLGETNGSYWSDVIAKSNANLTIGAEAKKVSPEKIVEARIKNRDTLIKYSVKGLKFVWHDDGKPATTEDIKEFINHLADDVIDMIMREVTNPENYRDTVFASEPAKLAEKS